VEFLKTFQEFRHSNKFQEHVQFFLEIRHSVAFTFTTIVLTKTCYFS